MPVKQKLPSGLVGIAGEYFVAAELSRRGFVASLTLKNTAGFDILVIDPVSNRSVTVQVKTNQQNERDWLMNEKVERSANSSHFYILVNLRGIENSPVYYIVPSCIVAERCQKSHRDWLEKPGKLGQPHVDNPQRKFVREAADEQYRDNWEMLKLGAA